MINDDEKWREILRWLNKEFFHKTIDYQDLVKYISTESGIEMKSIFAQYIQHTGIPTLEFQWNEGKLYGRWIAEVQNFAMPVKIRVKGGKYQFFNLNQEFSEIILQDAEKDNVEVDVFNYYIGVLFN